MKTIGILLLLAVAAQAETSKEHARTLYKQGEELFQQGQYPRAIERYKQAFALVPLPLLLFDLGQAYRLNGQRDLAIEHYQKYLDVEPKGRGAVEASEHLAELKAQIAAELEAKREAEAAREKAEAARRAAAEAAQRKAAEEARLRAERQAQAQRAAAEAARQRAEHDAQLKQAAAEEAQRQAAEEAQRRVELRKRRTEADAARPWWKKPWFWGTVAGAVVVVGVAAGVGAAYGGADRNPTATFGQVKAP